MAQGSTKGVPIETDDALASNSDALVPSVAATRAYIASTLNGVPNQFRMSLTSHLPVTTSDVTGAGTLYLVPIGEQATGSAMTGTAKIGIPGGSTGVWTLLSSAQVSLSLTLTSGKNYDVFAYSNAGTLTLALGSAWTNDTTRADALGVLDGAPVNSVTVDGQAANYCLYLGTIRASGSNTTEDSVAKRFVWNNYNRAEKYLFVTDATDSWTYGTDSWRYANNSSANLVGLVIGLSGNDVKARVQCRLNLSGGGAGGVGIGIDSGTVNSANIFTDSSLVTSGGGAFEVHASYSGFPGVGYHSLGWIERARSATCTFYGDAGIPNNNISGLLAEVFV